MLRSNFMAMLFLLLSVVGSAVAETDKYSDRPFIIVNNMTVTLGELERFVEQFRKQNPMASSDQVKDLKERFIKRKVEELLILSAAREEGFIASAEEVKYYIDERIKNIRTQFPDENEFHKALARENMSEAELRRQFQDDITEEILRRKIINKEIVSRIDISDEEVRNLFEEMEQEVFIHHILVTTRSKAKQVIDKLSSGEDFVSLVREYSESPDRENDGEMKGIKLKNLSEVLRDAVLDMAVGEVSGILESEKGYHIIKLEDLKEPDSYPEFTKEAHDQARELIFQKRLSEEITNWVDQIKDQAHIEIRDFLLDD